MMAAATKQPEIGLTGTPVGVQPLPMEMNSAGTGQMNLKTLLEAHIMEHPIESAFHG